MKIQNTSPMKKIKNYNSSRKFQQMSKNIERHMNSIKKKPPNQNILTR